MFQKGKKNPHSGGLNIMIVGCGKVGMTLVDRLSKEGHDISVVDKNERDVGRIHRVVFGRDVYHFSGDSDFLSQHFLDIVKKSDGGV